MHAYRAKMTLLLLQPDLGDHGHIASPACWSPVHGPHLPNQLLKLPAVLPGQAGDPAAAAHNTILDIKLPLHTTCGPGSATAGHSNQAAGQTADKQRNSRYWHCWHYGLCFAFSFAGGQLQRCGVNINPTAVAWANIAIGIKGMLFTCCLCLGHP